MRIAKYGLAFNYEPTTQPMIDSGDIIYPDRFIKQLCQDFALINYYFKSKKLYQQNEFGFANIEQQLFIEMFVIDTNPRKFIYDRYSDNIYKVNNIDIDVMFDSSQRKMYELPISLVNTSEIRLDKEFIKNKFTELQEVLNATI